MKQKSTRENIESTAMNLFGKRGYSDVSMTDIATVVGIKKASLYYHFKDKDQIFASVLMNILDQSISELDREIGKGSDKIEEARERLKKVLLKMIKKMEDIGMAVFSLTSTEKERLHSIEDIRLRIGVFINRITEFLKCLKVSNPEIAADVLFYSIHSYVIHKKYCGVSYTKNKFVDYLVSLVTSIKLT
jgi:AcrR family transcriptional regulator